MTAHLSADLTAADALLDAVGGRGAEYDTTLRGDDLAALLVAWREEIDSHPIPDHPAWRTT